MIKAKSKSDILDEIKEWVGALLPIVIIVIGLIFLTKWSSQQAQKKEAERKARVEKLMKSPNSTPTYNLPSSSSNNYVEERGTDECTSDCSGHEAGYDYAEENDICDTEYSDSHSDSFNEGVIAWSEDNC